MILDNKLGKGDSTYSILALMVIESWFWQFVDNNERKKLVKDFWSGASCGEELYLNEFYKDSYLNQSTIRYSLESEILEFAEFPKSKGKELLRLTWV